MATREIKIHIAANANLAAIRQVNTELAKMAMDVGSKNGDLRQATMLAAREYYNLGDASEKAATRAVLSAKQIEEAWRKAMTKPTDEASKGFGRLTEAARGAMKGIGGTFGQLGEMFLQGGIWGAMAAAATKAFTLIWDHFAKESERSAKRAERAFNESISSIKDGAAEIDKAFDSAMSGIDKAISRFDAMSNSVRELTKAEIELAKQHAIANGMDAASANAAAADLSAQVDFEAEKRRLQNLIAMEQKRVDAAKDAEAKTAEEVKKATEQKAAAEADYQKKRDEYVESHAQKEREGMMMESSAGAFWMPGVTADEARKSREDAALAFDESGEAAKLREKVRKAKDALDGIKTDEKALAAAEEARAKIEQAQTSLDVLETKREARELAVQNEIADKIEADHKAQVEKDKAAAEKRAEEEKKAAEKAAAERARLDAQEAARRERERQAELAARIRDHQKLLAAERAEESKTRSAVSAAESKLQQAWGWYRDKDSMAAQLAEEKADAQARKQFEKDFERLRYRRRDWRTAENLSVDDEAVRRVALAREEKEAAERHLAEIEKNTANLAEKLDELLQVKG